MLSISQHPLWKISTNHWQLQEPWIKNVKMLVKWHFRKQELTFLILGVCVVFGLKLCTQRCATAICAAHYPQQSIRGRSSSYTANPFLLITGLCQLHCVQVEVSACVCAWTVWQSVRARMCECSHSGVFACLCRSRLPCVCCGLQKTFISVIPPVVIKRKKILVVFLSQAVFTSEGTAFIPRALMKCASYEEQQDRLTQCGGFISY